MAWNTDSVDYVGNFAIFNGSRHIDFKMYGWAYSGISRLCTLNGLSFQCMEAIVTGMSLIILLFLVFRYTRYPAFVMSLFYVYPFVDSAIQRRFFPCMMFCMLAFHFYMQKKAFWQIPYIMFMYLAYGFHEVAVFFLPSCLLHHFSEKKLEKLVFLCTVSIFLVLNKLPVLLSPFIDAGRLDFYLKVAGISASWKGYVFILQIMLFIYLMNLLRKQHSPTSCNIIGEKIESQIYKLNIYTCLVLPLLLFDMVFTRFFRTVIIFDYMVCLSHLKTPFSARRRAFFLFWLYCLYLFVWAFLNTLVLGNNSFEFLVKPFFEHNVLLNYFDYNAVY